MACLIMGVAQLARGGDADAPATPAPALADLLSFDLPRLPLQDALGRYHAITGQSLLYEAGLVQGYFSNPVEGQFSATQALRLLLAGTGIEPRFAPSGALTLQRIAVAGATDRGGPSAGAAVATMAEKRAYYATLQDAVLQALCADPRTAPGSYRLALGLWVGEDQRIGVVRMHTSGDAVRDARIRQLLEGAVVGQPLPAGLSQPVVVTVLPRRAGTRECLPLLPTPPASAPGR